MSDPFTRIDRLGPGTEGHEVSLDNVLGVGRVQPHRHGTREVIRVQDLITIGARRCRGGLVHGQGWGAGKGRNLGSRKV